ncbi:hypothetical protein WR25_10313 isoform B [Diploscapter pachys]|uniref:Serine aminopeptidase S33 domain-containing protein n=1 Tax=Diploscapter pachys TaxID=2018661 RepID=A0A2A2KYU0_9BILA|nr:hypothetical protein WR25_10313 isoform A [Diploscapter pachys]PAV78984.1 hypothetical protein WR25_10313 isoform B [Diploscapter pachys]
MPPSPSVSRAFVQQKVTSVAQVNRPVDAVAKNENPSALETLRMLARLCGACCYFSCPPLPSEITRKIAFHPPAKGQTYKLKEMGADGKWREVDKLTEKTSPTLLLEVKQLKNTSPTAYQKQLKLITAFKVQTSLKNTLIGVLIRPSTVIVFCQPNSSDLGDFLQPLSSISLTTLAHILEHHIYAFDYSGYGFSSGVPSERGIYQDVRAVYEHILRQRPNCKIILMGYSIGTTAVIDMASACPPNLAGIVLLAPFMSGLRLIRQTPDEAETTTCCLDPFKRSACDDSLRK